MGTDSGIGMPRRCGMPFAENGGGGGTGPEIIGLTFDMPTKPAPIPRGGAGMGMPTGSPEGLSGS
jgi:hypothetical protein